MLKDISLRLDKGQESTKEETVAGAVTKPKMAGLEFNLTVKAVKKGNETVIVDGVSGNIPKGSMMVILGASGSGKSTLLQCIARRGAVVRDTKTFKVEGDVHWEGKPVKDKKFHRQCGFVTQDELFFAMLTVRETLLVAAKLRLSNKLKKEEISARVEELIMQLGLEDCANNKVGNERYKGISGGERKRLNIACELINTPNVLLLDEPTSGLDSASATRVVRILEKLKDDGKSIVCVLHQPRWGLILSFEQALIMHKSQCIFKGTPEDVNPYFADVGVVFPSGENTMDVVFDVINGVDVDKHQVQQIVDKASKLEENKVSLVIEDKEYDDLALLSESAEFKMNPWWYTFVVLYKRYTIEKLKDPMVVQSQMVFAVFFGIIVGVVFFDLGFDPTDIQSRIGCLSFSVLLQSFLAFDIILLFPKERTIYLRESGMSLYTPSAFFMARTLAELPSHTLNAAIFSVITFFMVGLRNFWEFFLLVQLTTHTGVSLLMAISAISKNLDVANVVASLVLVIFFLFDGFYIKESALPVALQWVNNLSFLGVAIKGAWKNELEGIQVDTSNCGPEVLCPYTNDEEALRFYEVEDVNVWLICLQLLAYTVGYRIVAFLGLKYLYKK